MRRFNHSPLMMTLSRWAVFGRFDSSVEVDWSPSAPQVGMFYMRCDFCSMKFLYVIARSRLGFSGCIPLRTVLRDSFASKDLTISFRCVFCFFFKHVFEENMVSSFQVGRRASSDV